MKVKFENKEYKKNGRNGLALKNLCFDIFKKYLSLHPNMSYEEIQNIFNKWHCNNNFVVLSHDDWEQKTENLKGRYFKPINYNHELLYFTTQWGNNGGDCDNISNMINFAHEQGYDIEILENDIIETTKDRVKYISNIKNIILYGSPGVGKTHNTNKLIDLIENGTSDKEIFETIKSNKSSDSVDISGIKDRVKFVTFHQSFGYEDFIEGFRPNGEGRIELDDGIFKKICEDARENLKNSQKEKSFNFELFFNDFVDYVEKSSNYELEDGLSIVIKKSTNGDFKSFQTQGRVKRQSLTYQIIKRDFDDFLNGEISKFEDIKPTFESQKYYHGNARYYFKLYQKMKDFLDKNLDNYILTDIKLQNYYIVIDEINRANISKVFGELITLIEEDKRDKLEVTLPYSKQSFKIPSNLYIIGTMNSTDKSIALIDIALRRRFTFLKMKPNAELITHQEAKSKFIALNQDISDSLGEDYQIGHSYFMNIESDDDLDFVLEYKIKPLLEEYFYGDDRLNNVLEIINR